MQELAVRLFTRVVKSILKYKRCCVVVYLRYGVTALARETIAIVLFTSGSKNTTHIQAFLQERRCCGFVYLRYNVLA